MLKMKLNVKLTAGTGRLFLLSFLRTQKENKEKWGITRKCQSSVNSRNMLHFSDNSRLLDEFSFAWKPKPATEQISSCGLNEIKHYLKTRSEAWLDLEPSQVWCFSLVLASFSAAAMGHPDRLKRHVLDGIRQSQQHFGWQRGLQGKR